MVDYTIITVVVKNGKVVNLLMSETEKEGIEHANYCLKNYGEEKGVTEIAVFKHNNDGLIEIIYDLSGGIQ